MAERDTPFTADDAGEAFSGPGRTGHLARRYPKLNARLTEAGVTTQAGLYAWRQVEPDAVAPSGWANIDDGLEGTLDDIPARERNANAGLYADPDDGMVVQLEPEPDGTGWLFDAGTPGPPGPPGEGGCSGCEDVTITYTDVDFIYNNVSITITGGPVTITGTYPVNIYAPVVIGLGLAWCGWWWLCPQTVVVTGGGPIDPSLAPPHMLERLVPAADGVVLPGIVPVAGPDGTQALFLTNVDPALSLVLEGVDWFLPGVDQLPLRMVPGDSVITWFDEADDVWRILAATLGDCRFKASDASTVTIWDPNRELNFVPEGDVGDVLTQTPDGPDWAPSTASPDWTIDRYKDECVAGVVLRYVKVSTMTAGVFDPGEWTFDRAQGCCECPEPSSGPCCFTDDHPDLCITFFGGLAALGTLTLAWGGAAWSGFSAACGSRSISLTCSNGLWRLDVSSCDPATVIVESCDPLYLTVSGPDCSAPCPGEWAARITLASSGGCSSGGEPTPPPCPCDAELEFTFTLSGITCGGGVSSPDGTYTLQFQSDDHCAWSDEVNGWLVVYYPDINNVVIFHSAGHQAVYKGHPGCDGGLFLLADTGDDCTGFPVSITITVV